MQVHVTIMVNPLVTLSYRKMKTAIWTLIAAGTVFGIFIDCLHSKLSVRDKITCKIMTEPDGETKNIHIYIVVSIFDRCDSPPFACFICCFHTETDYHRQIYRDTRHFTLYNGTFPVCPQQRTGACKCHVIVVVFTLRVQKLTPAELRLFATQCGKTITGSSNKYTHVKCQSGNSPVWYDRLGSLTFLFTCTWRVYSLFVKVTSIYLPCIVI